MGAPKGNTNGNRFSEKRQPKNRTGRKPSRMNAFIKQYNLENPEEIISREDANKLLQYILSCNKVQFEALSRNGDLPVSILAQIFSIAEDLKNKKTDTIDRITDRLYGKTTQPMELTGAKGTPLIPSGPMSRKDYEKLLLKLTCGDVL